MNELELMQHIDELVDELEGKGVASCAYWVVYLMERVDIERGREDGWLQAVRHKLELRLEGDDIGKHW